MATNFEFYQDEVLDWLEEAEGGAGCVALLYEKLSGNRLECDRECRECGKELVAFLNQEHIETQKLTKRERAFCETVQTGWIARDCDMCISYFSKKPSMNRMGVWMNNIGHHCELKGLKDDFMFIKDTDSEPWSVEDLLKLEVIEEVQESEDISIGKSN